jgi:hypothetical protein
MPVLSILSQNSLSQEIKLIFYKPYLIITLYRTILHNTCIYTNMPIILLDSYAQNILGQKRRTLKCSCGYKLRNPSMVEVVSK